MNPSEAVALNPFEPAEREFLIYSAVSGVKKLIMWKDTLTSTAHGICSSDLELLAPRTYEQVMTFLAITPISTDCDLHTGPKRDPEGAVAQREREEGQSCWVARFTRAPCSSGRR